MKNFINPHGNSSVTTALSRTNQTQLQNKMKIKLNRKGCICPFYFTEQLFNYGSSIECSYMGSYIERVIVQIVMIMSIVQNEIEQK